MKIVITAQISREGSKTPKSSSKLPVLSKSTNSSTTPPCNTPEKNVRSLTEQEDFSDSENMKKKQVFTNNVFVVFTFYFVT